MVKKMGLELDWETADRITLLNLKNSLDYLEEELKNHASGEWMHPDDKFNSETKYIPALKTLIDYYGG